MSKLNYHPVALADSGKHVGPQTFVERTAARATEGMILNSDFSRIEITVKETSPTPLPIVAIAKSSGAHG